MQSSRPNLALPGRAPAPPDRRAPPVSGGFLSHALSLSLSLALCPLGPTYRRQFLRPRSPFSLCLAGPVRQLLSRCPERPFPFSLRRGPSLSDLPSPRPLWTGECALAHVVGFLGHD